MKVIVRLCGLRKFRVVIFAFGQSNPIETERLVLLNGFLSKKNQ